MHSLRILRRLVRPGFFHACLSLTTLSSATSFASPPPPSGTFHPGERWLDTGGHPIKAHGGGVLWDESTRAYYWYGEQRTGPTYQGETNPAWNMWFWHADTEGVACYRSADLQNWTYLGIALPSVADSGHPLWRGGVINRPKVLRSPLTGKYVMWFHSDRSTYAVARSGVAVADSPAGPFAYLGNDRALPDESRDPSLFQDDDGKAYHLYTTDSNRTLRIARLTDDYLAHDPAPGSIGDAFIGESREAPVMFKHAGRYYIIASRATGWDPNPAVHAVADSPLGPWTSRGNPCVAPGLPPDIIPENTFRSQGTHIIPVPGRPGAFIFMANRWDTSDLQDSRHVWLPLVMRGDQPEIHWRTAWSLAVFDQLQSPVAPAPASPGGDDRLRADDTVPAAVAARPSILTGPWSGNLGPASASVSAAVDRPGRRVRAIASTRPDYSAPIRSASVVSAAETGNRVRLEFTGLAPDTDYYYALELDGDLASGAGQTGRFRTFPRPGRASFQIGFGSCGSWLEGHQFTYQAAAAENIRLFIQTGDLHYADTNADDPSPYRTNYRQALSLGGQGDLFRRHGSVYTWDDHDFSGDNSDRTGLGRLAHRQVYRELVPHYPLPDTPRNGDAYGAIYHAFTLGRARFIVSDLRSQRDPAAQADDTGKSMMGAAQKAWFKMQLLAARDAETPLIVWVSSVSVLSSDAGSENWSAYATERTELLTFIRDEKIQNVIILSGDMHGLAVDDGRGLAGYVRDGARIPVFHAASFTAAGSIKGGPYSHGASPGAGRYGLLAVNDRADAPLSVTFQGKIAASASDTAVWKSFTHVGEPVRPLRVDELSADADATGIALAWRDRSGEETGYRIERAADGAGPWSALATTGPSATRYYDAEAAVAGTYAYRIVSLNGAIASAPSASASVTRR